MVSTCICTCTVERLQVDPPSIVGCYFTEPAELQQHSLIECEMFTQALGVGDCQTVQDTIAIM